MSILPIRIYPDEVLRVRCDDVTQFDAELASFVESMIETMHAAPGVGLAAPQVGDTRRIAVVDPSVGEEEGELLVLVNPTILEAEGKEADSEGCLSIPGYTDKVVRNLKIRVRAASVEGEPFELDSEGFQARAIQHEIDHLNGVLFVDHLRGLRRERAKRALKKLRAQAEST